MSESVSVNRFAIDTINAKGTEEGFNVEYELVGHRHIVRLTNRAACQLFLSLASWLTEAKNAPAVTSEET